MVRRRDAKYVSGAIDANTGSSLYSRVGMIHMSIPSRAISGASTVSNRFLIHGVTIAFCSRCVSTRCVGSGYWVDCASPTRLAMRTHSVTGATIRRIMATSLDHVRRITRRHEGTEQILQNATAAERQRYSEDILRGSAPPCEAYVITRARNRLS